MATFDVDARIKPTQQTKSDELFQRVQEMLSDAGTPLKTFSEVYGVLIVPSMLLLEEQTIDRLSQAQTHLCVEDDPMKHVFKAVSIKKELGERLDELAEKIQERRNTLFLVVEDEAHTALQARDGSMKKFIYDKLQPHQNQNVFRLLVTATPQALVAVTEKLEIVTWDDLPELQFWQWRDHVIDETQKFYVGLMFYKAALDAYEDKDDKRKGLYQKDLTMEEDNVPRAYLQATKAIIDAMKKQADHLPTSTTFTQHVVKRLCTRPGMAVVRVEKHTAAQQFQEDMLDTFKEERQPFLVLLDTSVSKMTLQGQISGQVDALQGSAFYDRARAVAEMSKQPVYTDLEGLSVLLLIVDKGKVGMTFPDSMFCWDLRQRYRANLSEATFVQDAGRCFAWRRPTEIPLLLVNYQARQAVKRSPEIWLTGDGYKPDSRLQGKMKAEEIDAWIDSDDTDQIASALWTRPEDPDYVPPNTKMPRPTSYFFTLLRKHFSAKAGGALDLVTQHRFYPEKRTLLFCARPQVGKTGVFLRLWFLMRQYVTEKPKTIFLSFPDDNFVARLPMMIKKENADFKENDIRAQAESAASRFRPNIKAISAVQRKSDKKDLRDLSFREVCDGDVFRVVGEQDEDDGDGDDEPATNVFGSSDFMDLHRKLNKMPSSDLHEQLDKDAADWRRYHELYGQQRQSWRILPYQVVCDKIFDLADKESDTVVDLGCGEALLARDLLNKGLKSGNLYCVDHVYEPLRDSRSDDYFDARNAGCKVLERDISESATSVVGNEHSFVVLCLALMGKNWPTYLVTAAELLRIRGNLFIAEPNSKQPQQVVKFLEELGFVGVWFEPLGNNFHLYGAMKGKSTMPVRQQSLMVWKQIKLTAVKN